MEDQLHGAVWPLIRANDLRFPRGLLADGQLLGPHRKLEIHTWTVPALITKYLTDPSECLTGSSNEADPSVSFY